MENNKKNATVNSVIEMIRNYVVENKLIAGDKLPAERKLAEYFGITRQLIRQALQKLELYGIVKTLPQSGTVIENYTSQQIEMMINNALSVGHFDFASLVHVRVLLEIEALKLCAINRTESDLEAIKKALIELEGAKNVNRKVDADFNYHIAVSRGAHNPVITSLLLSIVPDIQHYYQRYKVCNDVQESVISDHREMLDIIIKKDDSRAESVIKRHLANQINLGKDNTQSL